MTQQPTRPETLTAEQMAIIVESSEATMYRKIFSGLPPELAAEIGSSWQDVGGATAVFFDKLPIAFFNRVIGLGLHQPATEAMIDELIGLYGRTRTPFGISVSPAAQPAELGEWLLARGFRHTSNWAKMIRGNEPAPHVETALEIREADEGMAGQFATIAQIAFEMPEWIRPLFVEMVRLPDAHSYIAYAGEEAAGVGTLMVSGESGALFNGATLSDFRRRGGQGAIMARRIQKGIARGCRWLTTETGEDTPDNPNPSYRNMLRTGFRLAYLRPNFVYEFA